MAEPQPQPRTMRRVLIGLALVWCVATLVVMALCCGGVWMLGPTVVKEVAAMIGGPTYQFQQETGYAWPANAQPISTGDDHGGFLGDGEFHLVFETDRATLDQWLAAAPPWGQAAWQPGPVPHDIVTHASLGVPGRGPSNVPYTSDDVEQVFESPQIWYAAQERCCPKMAWHNGSVLVIDLENRRVWMSIWDY